MRVSEGVTAPKLLGTVTTGISDLEQMSEASVQHLFAGRNTTFVGSDSSFGLFRSAFLDSLFSSEKFKEVPRSKDLEDMFAGRHLSHFLSYEESSLFPKRETSPVLGGLVIIENDASLIESLFSRDVVGELEVYHLVV